MNYNPYNMDFSKTLFRASSIGYLMTDPRSKKDKEEGNLSEGAKTHLIDVFVSNRYGRQTDIQNKYIQKGLLVEDDSITLYSRVSKRFHKKNEMMLTNDWVKGTPDLFTGLTIYEAEHIIDIKSSFDIFTFFRNHNNDLNSMYYWQVQTYMDLTGAKSASVVYCLVDTPEVILNDEKRRLMYKMGAASSESEDFNQACDELDRLMTYKDIPLNERMIEFNVERNQEDIDSMHARVERGREYLNQLQDRILPTHKLELK